MRHERRRQRRTVLALVAVVTVSSCATGGEAAPPTTPPSTTALAPATPAPTTAPPRTTTTSTTTLPPLGVPVAVPAPGVIEPEVVLGTIEIPAIGLVETLQSGIADSTLDRGPGHWPGTALPGEWGNAVVAGHRVSNGAPFRHLDQLVPGDLIVYETEAGRFEYAVTDTEIVPPDALWITDQTYDRRTTLFACHPPGSVRERIVVRAELVSGRPASDAAVDGRG